MNFSRYAAAGCAAMVIGAALPAVASATDYCVGASGCAQADTFATLESALAKAESAADSDRIIVGPGEFKAKAVTGFSYDRPDGPVEIIGAGRGQTVLTGLAGGTGNVLFLNGGDGTSMHDLTIRVPANVADNFRGLTLRDVARHIEVVQEPGQSSYARGVLLVGGGTLSDSTVTMTDWGSVGVAMQTSGPSAPNLLRDSTIAGLNAVYVDGGGRIERSHLIGETPGVYAKGGLTEIESSLIQVTSNIGIDVFLAGSPGTTSVRLEGDTLTGSGSPASVGVRATTGLAPDKDINVDIRNSVVHSPVPLLTQANGPGRVNITARFSAYDPAGNLIGGVSTVDQTDILRADPGFVDVSAGNLRLRPDSPLVDAGDPNGVQGADLDGNALIVDGNGDGAARRDIGAYELPAVPAPRPQADTEAPVISAFRARRAVVSYTLSESARVVVKVQRRLAGRRARYRTIGRLSASGATGANRTRASARLRRKEARPGRYRAVIVAVDAAGNGSAPKTAGFRVRRR